jgi:hypothetical protein
VFHHASQARQTLVIPFFDGLRHGSAKNSAIAKCRISHELKERLDCG